MSIWSSIDREDRKNEELLYDVARRATCDDWDDFWVAMNKLVFWESAGWKAFPLLMIGMTAFLSTILMDNWITWISAALSFMAMAATFTSFGMSTRFDFAADIYQALVKVELRRRTRLLPLWFLPEGSFLQVWPYRTRPLLTDQDCTRMRRVLGRFRQNIVLFASMIMSAVVYMHLSAEAFDNIALSVIPTMALHSCALFRLYYSLQWIMVLDTVIDYEDITGEKVLPDDIRQTNYILRGRFIEARERMERSRGMDNLKTRS